MNNEDAKERMGGGRERCEWCGGALRQVLGFDSETRRFFGYCWNCDGVVKTKPIDEEMNNKDAKERRGNGERIKDKG